MRLLIDSTPETINRFTSNARRIGIVMIAIGLIGIILPNLISLTINLFIGGIFLLSAVFLGYIAWSTHSNSITMWLKPFVLLMLALIVLFHPAIVLSVLGMLLALYFLVDGFAGIALAIEIKPSQGWKFMLLNGILSFAFGAFVLFNWPLASSWVIGMLVGISFLFDGIALLTIAGKLKTAK